MKINIICVGKLKERYWQDAADEYIKRLGRFAKVTVTELAEEKLRGILLSGQEQILRTTLACDIADATPADVDWKTWNINGETVELALWKAV